VKLVLVPNAELGRRTDDYQPIIPLGLLSLAAALSRSKSVTAKVCDPRSIDFRSPRETVDLLLTLDPDVVGFSTMCNTYPHALRTAQLLKNIRPELSVVFGGPHATVIAKETLEAFPFVDFVLKGECERSIIDLVEFLGSHDRKAAEVPGLIFRQGNIVQESHENYPLLPPHELPDIDYSLFQDLQSFRSIPLDVGRGCPFACTFCTTNIYWERRYRLRSPQYVIDTVKQIKEQHGLSSFGFVHDNFTASPHRVAEFCRQIITSGVSFEWRCSARPDSVDSELLDIMHAAGCRSIFMGIESGSPRIQQLCLKKVKLDRAIPAARKATALDIGLTVSFITGFPYEQVDDIEQTIRMMSAINYESRARCDLQLHLLSPVPGAPLSSEANIEIALDDTMSDVSAAIGLDSTMRRWISEQGKPIFESFFHYLNPNITRRQILQIRLGWFTLFSHLRLTVLALEEARRVEEFRLTSVFDHCEPTDGLKDAAAEFDWCVESVQGFLRKFNGAWARMVASILLFEAELHRLRLSGGSRIINTDYEINEWAQCAAKPDTSPGFPRRGDSHYLVMGHGTALKIARLPPQLAGLAGIAAG
jgi:radical SAM superfamily enzyme YgiQ (UPF0313 family)